MNIDLLTNGGSVEWRSSTLSLKGGKLIETWEDDSPETYTYTKISDTLDMPDFEEEK